MIFTSTQEYMRMKWSSVEINMQKSFSNEWEKVRESEVRGKRYEHEFDEK